MSSARVFRLHRESTVYTLITSAPPSGHSLTSKLVPLAQFPSACSSEAGLGLCSAVPTAPVREKPGCHPCSPGTRTRASSGKGLPICHPGPLCLL